MLGNLEMEIQTAQHIAANHSDATQRFVICWMLGTVIFVIALFFLTPLTLLGAAMVGLVVSAVLAIPVVFLRLRRQKALLAELQQLQMEQLKQHRAQN